jgi:acetyl-CoA synthetase
VENANVTRLARANAIASLGELRARSVADISWYWDAVVRDLDLPFRTPYSSVVDLTSGIEHPEWFVGSTVNVVDACLTKWAGDPVRAGRTAVVHEDEAGSVTTLTFAQLADEVSRVAAGLRAIGIGTGDAVAIYLPMIPEAVVACYATAWIGAILVPLFSGFAASAIASRLQDSGAKAVVVADGTVRRGRSVSMRPQLDEALAACLGVQHVIEIDNIGTPTGDATTWASLHEHGLDDLGPEGMQPSDPLLLGYTSGTTGKPKGAVHTHAGFLVKTASEVAYSFDLSPGGTFCWVTDMGWIMGPLSIIGTHANGASLLLYEGSPDVPNVSRLWNLAARHGVTMLGVSPTLVRTLRGSDDTSACTYDLAMVHTIGSTGEPWDPDSYEWLAREVFGGRVPIINFSGGTEVGGSFLAPYPTEPIRTCSLGGPSLGMDVDVVDEAGRPVRGEIGELICRQPWPSMTRGIWKDPDRYHEAYWSTYPGVWRHGDYALVDDDQWYILGRSDDVMNVAGKRLAPAEVEAILNAHPSVIEAAVVGIPDQKKGEAVWAFWVGRPDADDTVSTQLRDMVARELGKPFAPTTVLQVPALPKTRSAKIMRRAVRAAVLGTDPGDMSGAENPDALDGIRLVVEEAAK